jgi:hypothetical protein
MRPPTAPEYQPYEFAEIQYNPTFNDPNVEVRQLTVILLYSLVLPDAGLLLRSLLRASNAGLR